MIEQTQTQTAAHGKQPGIDLGSTIHDQERYGENPKEPNAEQNGKLDPTEKLMVSFNFLVDYLARLNPNQLQEIKTNLESSGSTDVMDEIKLKLVDATIQRKSAGSLQ